MKIIDATNDGGTIQLAVHIDEAKLLTDNSPDPAFVMTFEWAANMPVAVIRRETKLLVQAELARRATRTKVGTLVGVVL